LTETGDSPILWGGWFLAIAIIQHYDVKPEKLPGQNRWIIKTHNDGGERLGQSSPLFVTKVNKRGKPFSYKANPFFI
jgi:hypothetical protein